MLSPSIFKAYDIRGLYPQEFDEKGARAIASAFIQWLRDKNLPRAKLVVARDARPFSRSLAEAIEEVFAGEGVSVVDIGRATTPMYYFAIRNLDADGGAMVTASHNPAQFNGFKLNIRETLSVAEGTGLEEVRDRALAVHQQLSAESPPSLKAGVTRTAIADQDVADAYLDFLFSLVPESSIRPMRVAIDAGNGMCGMLLPKLLRRLPQLEVHELYFEPDGTFPNHEANPAKEETLSKLKETIRTVRADLGAAFDGDGDRVGFVTHEGEYVRGDLITAILGRYLLGKNPGQKVLYEVGSSRIVPEVIAASGGLAILVPRGHARINKRMIEEKALLGGEPSGHYFFRDFYSRESALLAFLRILEHLSREGKYLGEVVRPLKKYSHSGEMNFTASNKEAIMTKAEAMFPDARIKKIDGLTVEYDDWWFNLRPSNTEDLLRLNLEANTEPLMKEKLALIEQLIGVSPVH